MLYKRLPREKVRRLSGSELTALVGVETPNGRVISGKIVTKDSGIELLEYQVLPQSRSPFAWLRKLIGLTEMNTKMLSW